MSKTENIKYTFIAPISPEDNSDSKPVEVDNNKKIFLTEILGNNQIHLADIYVANKNIYVANKNDNTKTDDWWTLPSPTYPTKTYYPSFTNYNPYELSSSYSDLSNNKAYEIKVEFIVPILKDNINSNNIQKNLVELEILILKFTNGFSKYRGEGTWVDKDKNVICEEHILYSLSINITGYSTFKNTIISFIKEFFNQEEIFFKCYNYINI